MKSPPRKRAASPQTAREIAKLRQLLAEARATLRAIQHGEVDAVVVDGKGGPKVYTLDGADFDYRILIESMNEGALVLTRDALILYANQHFARMLARPLAELMGRSLYDLVSATDAVALRHLLRHSSQSGATKEVSLQRAPAAPMPARLSIQRFPKDDAKQVTIGMVVSDLTESQKREDLLRGFSQGLIQLQESERLQLAVDLGDNITQRLCSILVRCELLAARLPTYEAGLREEAVEFNKLLRSTASEVQRISSDLRPHGLEILGLDSAMREVATDFAARVGVAVKVTCAKLGARLPAEVELVLYRVLQEALRNVEQHAQARNVAVTLTSRGPVLRLAIKDDGIGFDTKAEVTNERQACRLGLLGMRERATAVGGSLKVSSSPSNGTEVCLKVPGAPRATPAA